MRLFLRDADASRKYNDRLKLFANQMREVTFSAEDVVDDFIYKLNRQPEPWGAINRGIRAFDPLTGCFRRARDSVMKLATKPLLLRDLDGRIRIINAWIEKISANKSRYAADNLKDLGALISSSSNVPRRGKRLADFEGVDELASVEDGIKPVKQMLLSEEDDRRMVVPIVGMGGSGKTTLAKKVYNSGEVKLHFDCRSWVCASQDYRIKDLLVGIAKDATAISDPEKLQVSVLGSRIGDSLACKKYLILVDDIWSTAAWDELSPYLPDSNNGSRILITTRNEKIALHADRGSEPYKLRLLNNEESWNLFVKVVFGSGVACPPELEQSGHKIVGKCGGLPIAILMLGNLLSRKEKSASLWQQISDSSDWHLDQGPGSCMGTLALSYNDLPYYLKSCFLYMGLFPEDCEIKANKLVRLWVAEGFIQRRGEGAILEDTAEDYLQELIDRNMIRVTRRRSDGRVMSCRTHDLLRDLAISEAKELKLFEFYNRDFTSRGSNIRRLITHDSLLNMSSSRKFGESHVRSLICFTESFGEESWRFFRAGLNLLTVLDLERVTGITTLPEDIGQLINLKFLCARGSSIKLLPWSIIKLTKLQTLDMRDTGRIDVSSSIWGLHQLRHVLGIGLRSRRGKYRNGDLGVEQLTSLQTLDLWAGDWLKNTGFRNLTQLRKLVTRGDLSKYGMLSEFVVSLAGLRSLCMHSETSIPQLKPFTKHMYLYKMRLEGRLQELPAQVGFYPPNLMKLELVNSQLRQDPMLVLEELPNLRILILNESSYSGKKLRCSTKGFRGLHSLRIEHLSELEEWEVEEGSLPALTNLEISDCNNLKRLPKRFAHPVELSIENVHEDVDAKGLYRDYKKVSIK